MSEIKGGKLPEGLQMPKPWMPPTPAPPEKVKARTRIICQVPDIPPKIRSLQSQNALKKRFVDDPETWTRIQEWVKHRTDDLVYLDRWDRTEARKRAWVEVSFKHPPDPDTKFVRWPDKQAAKREAKLRAKIKEEEAKVKARQRLKLIGEAVKKGLTLPPEGEGLLDPELFPGGKSPPVSLSPMGDSEHDAESFVRDILWVYSQLDVQVDVLDSPSPGAWSLLQWSRDNKDAFYKNLVSSALSTKEKLEKMRLDAHIKEKQLEADIRKKESDARKMSNEEVEELAETLDLIEEFGLKWADVSEGIKAPMKEPPDNMKEQVGWDDQSPK